MLDKEREKSDKRYAMKLTETIVFALIGMIAIAVIGAIIRLVIINPKV